MDSIPRQHACPGTVQQACDSCRSKRIRCELCLPDSKPSESPESQPSSESSTDTVFPCKACYVAGINCTFDIPVRRRGRRSKVVTTPSQDPATPLWSTWRLPSPRSLHTSVEKRQKAKALRMTGTDQVLHLERPMSRGTTVSSTEATSPRSIGDSLSGNADSFNPTPSTPSQFCYNPNPLFFSTDCICSKQTFNMIIYEWLELVYPLIPIVHRPTFRGHFEAQRERTDPIFFALLSCLCASLLALIPSSFEKYRELDESLMFETRLELVEFCHQLAVKSRRPDYFDESTQEKWSIAYLLAAAYGNLGYLNRCLMFAAEARHHLRRLGCQEASSYSGLSKIEAQLRKRSLSLSLCGYIHETFLETLSPHEFQGEWFRGQELEHLLPLEVDDEYIVEDEIFSQPEDETPVTAGLSILSRIYYLAASVTLPAKAEEQAMKLQFSAHSPQKDNTSSLVTKLATLKETFRKVKYASDEVFQDFNEWPKSTELALRTSNYGGGPLIRQFEIMRANVLVSRLWLQSVILEEIVSLSTRDAAEEGVQGNQDERIHTLWNEREDICRQLLHALRNFSRADLEPNGASLVYKIRMVAATLLDCPFEDTEPISRRASSYVNAFVEFLSGLDPNITRLDPLRY